MPVSVKRPTIEPAQVASIQLATHIHFGKTCTVGSHDATCSLPELGRELSCQQVTITVKKTVQRFYICTHLAPR